eukprot:8152108-Pyramimonas_sp.AAC.1
MDHRTHRRATSREEMQALQREWGGWWQVSAAHPELVWPLSLGEPPPPPTVEQLKVVLQTFMASTGTGFDQVAPRLFTVTR